MTNYIRKCLPVSYAWVSYWVRDKVAGKGQQQNYWTEAVQVTNTDDRPDLSSEGAPDIDKTVNVKQINIRSRDPDGARYQDGLTDWSSVVMWLWLWLWLLCVWERRGPCGVCRSAVCMADVVVFIGLRVKWVCPCIPWPRRKECYRGCLHVPWVHRLVCSVVCIGKCESFLLCSWCTLSGWIYFFHDVLYFSVTMCIV
jgi:hypothetical protein